MFVSFCRTAESLIRGYEKIKLAVMTILLIFLNPSPPLPPESLGYVAGIFLHNTFPTAPSFVFFKYSSRAVPDMLLLDYFVFLISWIIIQLLYFMVLAFKGKDGIEILKWNIEIYLWTAQINTLHILKYFSSFSSSRFPLSPRPDSVHSTTSSSDSHDSDENYVPMNPNQSTDDPVGGFTS